MDISTLASHDIALMSNNDPLAISFSSSADPDGAGSSWNAQTDDTDTKNAGLDDDASVNGTPRSDVSRMESRMRKKQEEQQYHGRMMLQQYSSAQ